MAEVALGVFMLFAAAVFLAGAPPKIDNRMMSRPDDPVYKPKRGGYGGGYGDGGGE